MSYISQLDPLPGAIDASYWLIIDTPTETYRFSAGALRDWLGAIQTVNGQSPTAGNVNLTPEFISDVTTDKKFTTATQRALIALLKNDGDGTLFLANDGTYKPAAGGGGGITAVFWGDLEGNIEDQEDLMGWLNYFDSNIQGLYNFKQDLLTFTPENIAKRGAANGYAPLDAAKKIPLINLPEIAPTGGRIEFQFDADLFTEDEKLFRGLITIGFVYYSTNVSFVQYMAKVDGGSYTWLSDTGALQTWINSNVSGNEATGTKYFIKAVASFTTTGSGLGSLIFKYT